MRHTHLPRPYADCHAVANSDARRPDTSSVANSDSQVLAHPCAGTAANGCGCAPVHPYPSTGLQQNLGRTSRYGEP